MFEITQVSIYNEKNEDSAEQRQTKLKREQTGKCCEESKVILQIFQFSPARGKILWQLQDTDVIANSNTSWLVAPATYPNLPF